MRKLIIASALAGTAIATPAFAQDTLSPFTGAHVELTTGVDRLRGGGTGETGLQYGIAGGYDIAMNNGLLLGIEGEAADATTRDCERNAVINGDRACFKAKRDLYAGGRVGITRGSTLLYGKVGYTNARLGVSYDDGIAGAAGDFSDAGNLDGVRVGGGLETNIGKFLAKAEYRYSNYESGISRHQGVVGLGVRF